jgi:hypothetical protein
MAITSRMTHLDSIGKKFGTSLSIALRVTSVAVVHGRISAVLGALAQVVMSGTRDVYRDYICGRNTA